MNEYMNNKGFSQIAIFIAVGVGLLLIALSSYTQIIRTVVRQSFSGPSPTAVPLPSNFSYSPALSKNQQMLINNKERIMKNLDLTQEQFEGIVKMASDPEFDY